MPILDMDVTARRDPAYIRSREFARVRKGYDPDQVRDFLHQVAAWFDDVETDLASARAESLVRPPREFDERPAADPYSLLGERVAEVLRTAEQHAELVRTEAEEASQRMLDEARQESLRLRQRAQEESEAVRQSAQEQAETTRHTAQDEADRVREEAARALEEARVEAERMVAGLSERRNALAAELHATKARLMGIVTGLEEEPDQPEVSAADPFASVVGAGLAADDPRRDPLPRDIPPFVPPTPPRVTLPGAGADAPGRAGTSAPRDERKIEADNAVGESATTASAEAGTPAGEAGTAPAGEDSTPSGTATVGEENLPTETIATAEPTRAPEGPTEGSDEPPAIAAPEADDSAASDEAPGPPNRPPAEGSSWLWTPEEQAEEPGQESSLDLSFPDFDVLDIPSLEDEEHE
jgi:DivIVA domain-containing protein